MKFSSIRSLGALVLLLVFVWGQFALLPTVMMRVASMSGEHQLVILDQKLVLHHVASPGATHHGITQWLVALSHTDASGDHVLPLNEPDRCDESREQIVLDETTDAVLESWNFAHSDHALRSNAAMHAITVDQHRSAEMAIEQWSSIRLLI